jgi:FkbM family methyltransferase
MSIRRLAKSILGSALAPFGLQVSTRREGRLFDYDDALQTAFNGVEKPLVLDIGANEGQSVKYILDRCKTAEIIAFEPNPHAFAALKRLQDERPFTCFNVALGDTDSETELHVLEHSESSSLLRPSHAGTQAMPHLGRMDARVKVPVRRLDDLMRETNASRPVDLLKIDVQGYEAKVLAGGAETLKRSRYVLAETHFLPAYEGACCVDELCHLLYGAGFRLVRAIGYQPATHTLDLVSTDLFFRKESLT